MTSKDGGSEGHGLNHLRWRFLAYQCQKQKRRRYEANPEHVKKTLLSTLAALGFFARQSWLPEWFSRYHPPETNSRMGPNAPEKFHKKTRGFRKRRKLSNHEGCVHWYSFPSQPLQLWSPHTFRSQGAQHVARTHLAAQRWAKRYTKETIIYPKYPKYLPKNTWDWFVCIQCPPEISES